MMHPRICRDTTTNNSKNEGMNNIKYTKNVVNPIFQNSKNATQNTNKSPLRTKLNHSKPFCVSLPKDIFSWIRNIPTQLAKNSTTRPKKTTKRHKTKKGSFRNQ